MSNDPNPLKPNPPESPEEDYLETKPKIKKEAAKPVPKFYWDVKVETMLPATLTYRIFAETAEQAADLIKGQHPTSVQHKLSGRKDAVLRVYNASGSMLRFMKKLLVR